MAADVRIQCINKRDRQSPHERISHVGGVGVDGKRWKLTEDQAITGTKDGTYSFYVNVDNRRVDVIVAIHEGRQYLKTKADGVIPNNLLSLPECP
jgi:hypothetical protein